MTFINTYLRYNLTAADLVEIERLQERLKYAYTYAEDIDVASRIADRILKIVFKDMV